MRNILFILLLSVSFSTQAGIGYDSHVEIPIATLGFSKAEISQAAESALEHYRWTQVDKTETSIKANYRGSTPLAVNFSDDQKITIRYKKKKSEFKLYRRLLSLKKLLLVNLTDCNSKGAAQANQELDAVTKERRNIVYALTKAGWVVKKLNSNKIVAKSPGNGRVEAEVTSDGTIKMQRWDEMESDYTDPGRDRYLKKVRRVYDRQVSRCSK